MGLEERDLNESDAFSSKRYLLNSINKCMNANICVCACARARACACMYVFIYEILFLLASEILIAELSCEKFSTNVAKIPC